MCIKIKYKNGKEKKFNPDLNTEEQMQDMESFKVEGKTSRQEQKLLLSLVTKELEKKHKKIENKFDEIKLS